MQPSQRRYLSEYPNDALTSRIFNYVVSSKRKRFERMCFQGYIIVFLRSSEQIVTTFNVCSFFFGGGEDNPLLNNFDVLNFKGWGTDRVSKFGWG